MLRGRMFKLDDRLKACAALVRDGARVADIGTDHAYLPIYLVKNNIASKAIACDINEGPLARADLNIKKYKVQDKASVRLSDGLEVVFPNEIDDVIIAGMGGELIARIISNAPWLKDSSKHLILQPMTAAEELRDYLKANGFFVEAEAPAIAAGKPYSAMMAYYAPELSNDDPLFRYIGLVNGEGESGIAYIQRVIRFYENKYNGLLTGGQSEETDKLKALIESLKERINQHEQG